MDGGCVASRGFTFWKDRGTKKKKTTTQKFSRMHMKFEQWMQTVDAVIASVVFYMDDR